MKICKKCKSRNVTKHKNETGYIDIELSTGIKKICIEDMKYTKCNDCEEEFLSKSESGYINRQIYSIIFGNSENNNVFSEEEIQELREKA